MSNLDSEKQHILYLFGAGATHAELANLQKEDTAQFQKEKGLLINHVSDRVIEHARRDKDYIEDIKMVSSVKGSLNIELLISLIESSRIKNSARKTSRLKDLVKKDIEAILTLAPFRDRF